MCYAVFYSEVAAALALERGSVVGGHEMELCIADLAGLIGPTAASKLDGRAIELLVERATIDRLLQRFPFSNLQISSVWCAGRFVRFAEMWGRSAPYQLPLHQPHVRASTHPNIQTRISSDYQIGAFIKVSLEIPNRAQRGGIAFPSLHHSLHIDLFSTRDQSRSRHPFLLGSFLRFQF